MNDFLDIILHTDEKLLDLVNTYGTFTYFILFMIIFCETGLVFFPFLPGDALLFAAGILAATGSLNVLTLAGIVVILGIIIHIYDNYLSIQIVLTVTMEMVVLINAHHIAQCDSDYWYCLPTSAALLRQ